MISPDLIDELEKKLRILQSQLVHSRRPGDAPVVNHRSNKLKADIDDLIWQMRAVERVVNK